MKNERKGAAPGAVSRRAFLRTTAAALPALGVANVHAAGDDTIRLGLIGCGDRGTGAALDALRADRGARLVAVADIFADHARHSLEAIKAKKGDQVAVDKDHVFTGFGGAERLFASDVDAVLIACATRFHPEYTRRGIEAGKHVFVEKPHAIDAPGVRIVTAACEQAAEKKLCVVSGLHRRHEARIRETVMRVLDGAIGEIVAMEVSFLRPPYRICARDPAWSEMEWQYKTWYHFNYLSGDDVPQSLVHPIDTAQWAMGEEPPITCHGMGGRSASIGHEYGNVFDHQAVVYEYKGGARMYGVVRTQHGCHNEYEMKIFGTKGRAYEGRIEGEQPWRFEGSNPSGHQQEQIAFLGAIRGGRPINDGLHMARSTMVAIMGQMACYTGRKIGWEEARGSDFAYEPRTGPCDFTIDPPVKPGPDGLYPVPVPGKFLWT
ncbi:MAG TPA: Gfo/Idh/MocA family oxidoreductase [Planctomycetota bacterium]|jgi:predicted dehydrogenase|nr:Gfo/Idh/MocA family oxidoreductase [Planctomycetota bacterium]OQC21192.1 MAG: Inositol 2-dehydrogenase/D-chiro-inositol 3-dehydrogenase [Planctomycetes bacterium ADurb.Bin069]NMD36369.1 Gfo/Idh/MocA family oxidoreductase [Planctomycetota bacterium]HNR99131.1 Gfo/Idh/MocA family oxidoreductase [Planctomycetota bacterium]HNU25832.1 Gfo/Idh/MocA family oxidoreductase [Planctomycetota bacterium]